MAYPSRTNPAAVIQWTKYLRSDGEWAEFGAFILEAATNGTWVVRHKTGALPCRASADLRAMPSGGIDEAKASCERVLSEILAAPNGIEALASNQAVAEQHGITLALCKRYVAARAMGVDAQQEALGELDRRVLKYLEKTTQND